MHIIIIEGITTSGKTSVFTNLKRYADEHKIRSVFVSEEETTTPYIDSINLKFNKDSLSVLVRDKISQHPDLLVFDRLYFAHTFKTGGTAEDFKEIEELLNEHDTTMFFLEIPELSIGKRIIESMQYRYRGWVDYVMNRAGGDINEVISFYTNRQRESKNLFNKSILKKYILDTASQNYVAITREIIDKSNIRPDQFFA